MKKLRKVEEILHTDLKEYENRLAKCAPMSLEGQYVRGKINAHKHTLKVIGRLK